MTTFSVRHQTFSPFEYHLRWKRGANLASRLFRSGEWGWVVTVDLYAGPPMSRGCGSAQQTTAEASLVEFPLAVSGFATVGSFESHRKFITMTSQWEPWRPKSSAYRLFAQPFVQAHMKKNIKAQLYWPLWGESTGDRWIPLNNAENVAICQRHHGNILLQPRCVKYEHDIHQVVVFLTILRNRENNKREILL